MNSIAEFGYSGNPTTRSHCEIVRGLLDMDFTRINVRLAADRVDKTDPSKANLLPMEQRLKIAQVSLRDHVESGGVHLLCEDEEYVPTADRMRLLQAENPESRIVFVAGADHFVARERVSGPPTCDIRDWWEDGEFLMNDCHFLALSRKGIHAEFGYDFPRYVTHMDRDIPLCSATQVRKGIADNQDISDLVHPDAHDLIISAYSV